MGTAITWLASSYTIPALGEDNWGTDVTNYLIAISTGALSKSGGSFTLTAETDFGANFGLKAISYKSRGTVSSTGVLRLANNESVGWRNAANGADKLLKVNASDILEFDGNPIPTIALGAADTVLQMNGAGTAFEFAKINNANIDASAAIAYSKLNLSDSIVNADINSAAAIAYSKLNLATSIVNGDISASAAIARSKLAAGTADHVVINAGDGTFSSEASLAITRGGTGAATANAGFNALAPTTTRGDLIYRNATVNARLAVGGADTVLKSDATDPSWGKIVNANIDAAAAIDYSKLALTNLVVFGDLSSSSCTIDEDDMSSDSAVRVPTQQSVKAYVDNEITAVTGAANSFDDRWNYSLVVSHASSELTIALKTKGGSDPSAGSPVSVGFRGDALTDGDYEIATATGATSIVVPSTATLGFTSNVAQFIFVYGLNNGGTLELMISPTMQDETVLYTTTTIDTGADSLTGTYSSTGRTTKAIRFLGAILSTQAAAGTWASGATSIDLEKPFYKEQTVDFASSGNYTAGTVKFVRRGNVVNAHQLTSLTHASAATASSASGAIPSWARPVTDYQHVYQTAGSFLSQLAITTAGVLTTNYRDWGGSTANQTSNGGVNFSTTYIAKN